MSSRCSSCLHVIFVDPLKAAFVKREEEDFKGREASGQRSAMTEGTFPPLSRSHRVSDVVSRHLDVPPHIFNLHTLFIMDIYFFLL